MTIDRPFIEHLHSLLHAGDVDAAHSEMHRALGLDDSDPMRLQGTPAEIRKVEKGIQKLCRQYGVTVAWIGYGRPEADGSLRIMRGGDAQLSRMMTLKGVERRP